jgi:UDP-N-acetylglucosamine:LPS N-acetylglucosamine transferase
LLFVADVVGRAPCATGRPDRLALGGDSVTRKPKVLAIASAGGHWVQLLRLAPAWDGCDITYISTKASYKDEVETLARVRGQSRPTFHVIPDVSRWSSKLRIAGCACKLFFLVLRTRPDVVVTTGAAPGFFALAAAMPIGAKRIWIDSIANVETMSLSGRKARSVATLWMTQWPHIAEKDPNLTYRGRVI